MATINGTKGPLGNAEDVEFRDPAVYAGYEKQWSSIPEGEAGWLQRAQEVADVLATDAVVRDQENKSPRAEVALLKYSGLLKILGPKQYGGGGQQWSVAYKAIRKVAETDGYDWSSPVRVCLLIIVVQSACCSATTSYGRPRRTLSAHLNKPTASRSL
jgi:hypothetical protein